MNRANEIAGLELLPLGDDAVHVADIGAERALEPVVSVETGAILSDGAIQVAALHYVVIHVYINSSEPERNPAELRAMIEKGLAKLPERCRLAVMLRLTENLSNTDIAQRSCAQ